jgi:uncharacterized protein
MENTFFGSKHNRFFGSLALVLAIVALGAYAYYTMQQARYYYTGPVTISVVGEAEVNAEPDIAKFSFTVTEKGSDGTAAQGAATAKSNEIVTALKEAGVEEKDIKSDYYNLYPTYKYEDQPCAMDSYFYCPTEQIEDGYEVSHTFTVKVRNKDKAGELLAMVGQKGATNLTGLEFVVDNDDAVKAEARAKAIADAKAKAEVLARDLGVRITEMTGYYEDEGYVTPYYGYGMGGEAMYKDEAMAEAPIIPAGENTVTSRVTITYQVK